MAPTLKNSISILRQLIAYETVSKDTNLELIHYVCEYLKSFNLEPKVFYNQKKTKANLFVTIGPPTVSGLIFSGHSDVVPVTNQQWQFDPFKLTKRNNKLYGRGTADMKAFIAVVLASVPLLIDQAINRPFHIAISYDEEIGCVGVRSLIHYLDSQPIKPLGCIVGEPTQMQLATTHKGKKAWRIQVKGKPGHSALPHLGINAIEQGVKVVDFIVSDPSMALFTSY